MLSNIKLNYPSATAGVSPVTSTSLLSVVTMQGAFIFMLTQKQWEKIAPTETELVLLDELKTNADPTERLKPTATGKTYYQILKQWICFKWHMDLQEENFETANFNFTTELKQLKEDYERDTTLWLELKKATDNVWSL